MTDHFADAGKPMPEPFGYFKPEPFGWIDCAATDEGARPLFDLETVNVLRHQKLQAIADQADQMTADEALMRQALEALKRLDEWLKIRSGGTGLMPDELNTITAIKERLK